MLITDPKILPYYNEIHANDSGVSDILKDLEGGRHGGLYTIQSDPKGPNGIIPDNQYDPRSRILNFQPDKYEVSAKDDDFNKTIYVKVPPYAVLSRGIIQMNHSLSSSGSSDADEALTHAHIFNQSIPELGYRSLDEGNAAREAEVLLGQPQGLPGIAFLTEQPEPGSNGHIPNENEQRTALIRQINPDFGVLPENLELGLAPHKTEIVNAQLGDANTDALKNLPGIGSRNLTERTKLASQIAEGQSIFNNSLETRKNELLSALNWFPVEKVMAYQKILLNESAIADFGKHYSAPEAYPNPLGGGSSASNSNTTKRSQGIEEGPSHFEIRA